MKKFIFIISLLFLTACQSQLPIDKNYQSIGQDSRIQYIIIHYTAADLNHSLYLLTNKQVSSHYLIDSRSGKIYQLVNDNQRAWHAGLSSWQNTASLNASSIGIELVNLGYTETSTGRRWYPYTPQQIDSLISLLRTLQTRYHISPDHILAHSDIAPQRKTDPGPFFPWKRLAEEKLIHWPNETTVERQTTAFNQHGLPSISWFQKKLASIGYAIPQTGVLDKGTKQTISAFQMKYQPENYSGRPNTRTAALIQTILNKDFMPM